MMTETVSKIVKHLRTGDLIDPIEIGVTGLTDTDRMHFESEYGIVDSVEVEGDHRVVHLSFGPSFALPSDLRVNVYGESDVWNEVTR